MSDIQARLELARLLSRSEATLGAAVEEYRRVLKSAPANRQASLELAQTLARMGRYEEARRLLAPLTDGVHPDPAALAVLGDVRLYSGDVSGAALAYGAAFRRVPGIPGLERKWAEALSWSGKHAEALPVLSRLHQAAPSDSALGMLLARALVETGKRDRAKSLLDAILRNNPNEPGLLVDAARLQSSMGRTQEAKRLLDRAVELDASGKAAVARAEAGVVWGDFRPAEAAARTELQAKPGDLAAALKLSEVLAGEQRFQEAAEILEGLLSANAENVEVLSSLGRLRVLEKNPGAALEIASRLSALPEGRAQGARLESKAKRDLGDIPGALAAIRGVVDSPEVSQEDYRLLGDLLERSGDIQGARQVYGRAAGMSPTDPWSAWKASGEAEANLPRDPADLAVVADELRDEGRYDRAGDLYRKALAREPEDFRARMGLAEMLAATGWYDQAVALLDDLLQDFPGSSKILLIRARVLAWARRYDQALATYDELIRQAPQDPVLLREAARTAFWAKDASRGQALYSALETQSASETIRDLARLERQAKTLGFDRRFQAALIANDALLAVEPGNQEALFDRAQAACALGLCDQERSAYDRLLAADPLHTMAQKAKQQLERRNAPSATASFTVWDEDGKSGRLAQITRWRWDLETSVRFEDRYSLRAAQHLWIEAPKAPTEAQQGQNAPISGRTLAGSFIGSYLAEGQTVGGSARFNQYLSGDFSFTNKQYFDARLRPLYSGSARVEANLDDLFRIEFFYQRLDEITNNMSLAQGIQVDNWGAGVSFQPHRRLDLSAQGRLLEYTDGNQGTLLRGQAGAVLLDHPHELKLSAAVESRNTSQFNRYVYTNGVLDTIIHPYWTPQGWISASATLGWRHDLAKDFFCGAARHFYGIQLSAGTDNTTNPFWRLEVQYMNDFTDHWSFSIKGLIHRSPQWDALGAWAGLTYRF